MHESGVQLAPYRSYLETARRAANRGALSLSWRMPSRQELHELDRRLRERHAAGARRADAAPRRRNRREPSAIPRGAWVVLEPRPGRAEEPETTFEAFLEAKEVYDRAPVSRGKDLTWLKDARHDVLAFDREGLSLLLARLPADGRLLFLHPNTWPLDCQRHALGMLEDRPAPRVAPLLRLVSTRPTWPDVVLDEVPESAWVFLRRAPDGSLRDGASEQREFVQRALGTPDFAVLEGPPGSGKTTAICELVVQAVRAGQRVLLVASTHVAVDNVLERLIDWQDGAEEKLVLPMRIGDVHSVTSPTVRAWLFRDLLHTWSSELLDYIARPFGPQSAGAAARRMLQEALSSRGEDSAFARLLLDASNLVCGTTIGILQHPAIKAARKAGDDFEPFDLLIVDEASKTTFTEFLVPAVYARRWVVVGDRRQLSPYVEERDLAENLSGLLAPEHALAAVHTFVASAALPPRQRLKSLIAVHSDVEARRVLDEARARNVVAVDLDQIEPSELYGVEGACPELLYADVVCGKPETLAAWQQRLPGDLESVAADVPELPEWEAHRRALGTHAPDEPVTWAQEVAWRQVRAHELRDNAAEAQRLGAELNELLPKSHVQTPSGALERDLMNLRRVSMPSILEILQMGAGSLGWDRETALTGGLPTHVLDPRMVSLSFQHRMHPEISAFPRERFYSEAGLLNDALGMNTAREWGYRRYARRATWLDIAPPRDAGRRRGPGNANPAEAGAVMEELREFVRWAAAEPRPGKDPNAAWEVAVLTFYRAQEKLLRTRLQELSGQRGSTRNFQLPQAGGRVHVTLCTVDRYQGHEADLVLLSFVKSGAVGFLNSPNRLNVALTRARYQLVLVGHRSWMAAAACRSELLRDLGASPLYSHDIAWESR